jgi:hypothetical protein
MGNVVSNLVAWRTGWATAHAAVPPDWTPPKPLAPKPNPEPKQPTKNKKHSHTVFSVVSNTKQKWQEPPWKKPRPANLLMAKEFVPEVRNKSSVTGPTRCPLPTSLCPTPSTRTNFSRSRLADRQLLIRQRQMFYPFVILKYPLVCLASLNNHVLVFLWDSWAMEEAVCRLPRQDLFASHRGTSCLSVHGLSYR